MPTKTELNELYAAAHKLKQVTEERDALRKELADTKLLATDNANWFDALKVDYDKLKVELAAIKNQEPIGYAINVFGFDGSVIRKTPLAQDFVPVYATAGAKEKTE